MVTLANGNDLIVFHLNEHVIIIISQRRRHIRNETKCLIQIKQSLRQTSAAHIYAVILKACSKQDDQTMNTDMTVHLRACNMLHRFTSSSDIDCIPD
jgi:hypothetical protein